MSQQLKRSRKWEGQQGTRIQAGQRNRAQDDTREVNKKRYVCAYRAFVTATKGADDLCVLRLFPGAFPMPKLKMQKDILHSSRREKPRKRTLAFGRRGQVWAHTKYRSIHSSKVSGSGSSYDREC